MTNQTYCRICEAACGLRAERENGRIIRLLPDKTHPVSQGYMCAKGTRFAETSAHPRRLRQPQRRLADGSLETVSWEAAMDLLAAKLRPILDEHGPHAIGVYYGNPMLFNALGLVSVLAFTRALGTRNVYSSFSQDCNNKFAAARLLHGGELIHPIPDLAHADFALMLGTNPAVSQGSFVHYEGGATAVDRFVARGGEVVWVDPRRSESAQRWGEWLPVRPGSDVYLLLALLHELRHLYQPDGHTAGLDDLLALAAHYPADTAAAFTAIPAAQIRALAQKLQTANATTFALSVGVNMGPFGTLAYAAMQALAYLCGSFDARGGLLFHPMGPLLSNLLHRLGIGANPQPSRVGGFVGVFDELPGGILADEILTSGAGQIRALINVAGNPLRTIPGEARLRQALDALEFMVHIDLFANETAAYADLILPAAGWLERFDVATTTAVFQTGGMLQYGGPLQEPPGCARPERQIFGELALRLQRPLFSSPRLTHLLAHPRLDHWLVRLLDGVLLPYRALHGMVRAIPTPAPKAERYLGKGSLHPDKKVHFWSDALAQDAVRLAAYAQSLSIDLKSSNDDQLLSSTDRPTRRLLLTSRRRRLGHNSWLHGALPEADKPPQAWLAPVEMAALGVADGEQIRIASAAGTVDVAVKGNTAVSPGTIILPHGLPEANINAVIPSGPDHIEPISGNHIMTGVAVQVTAVSSPIKSVTDASSAKSAE